MVKKLSLLIISIVFTLLLLELAVRSFDVARGFDFFGSRRSPFSQDIPKIVPFRTFGFNPYKVKEGIKYISSQHGELFPIEKPKGIFRIVVFGGSTTVNKSTFHETGLHYPLAVQNILREKLKRDNIEVINAGNSGYSTAHSLILLELDVLSWQPDLVILSHNVNDLMSMYFPDFTFDYSNKYSNAYFGMPDLKFVYTPPNILFKKFQIYWILKERLNRLSHRKEGYPPMRRKSQGDQIPKVVSDVFKRNLKSFAVLAKSNNIKVALASQALTPEKEYFDLHQVAKPYNDVILYPLHKEFVNHHKQFNKAIESVTQEEGIVFIDNNAALAGNKNYFFDHVHYLQAGVDALAQNVATTILKNNLIQ